MPDQSGKTRPRRSLFVAGIILSILLGLTLFGLLIDRANSMEDEPSVNALDEADSSEDLDVIRVLAIVPMAWFDDFEVVAVRDGLLAFPEVVLTYAGPTKGYATSHAGYADLYTNLALKDVDPSLYDAIIVHGACTHHHQGVPPAPLDYAEMDRILREADEAGKVIAAAWEGVTAIHHANLLEGRSPNKVLPGYFGNTQVMLPSPGGGPQSTVILTADTITENPHFVESVLSALGLIGGE